MVTNLSKKAHEAFVQYSKKMCTSVAIFWMVYRLFNFVVVLIRPEIAHALVDLCAGVDTIMIVNISTYTGNSISEKAIMAYNKRKNVSSSDNKTDDEEDEETEDDDSNG